MQVAANAAAAKDKLKQSQESEGARLGVDIAKHKAQMAVQQAAQRANQKYQQPSKKEKD
jgi:hypothetical protein